MKKFLSLLAIVALASSMCSAVVIEDFENWTGVGTPVADPDDASNTVLALTINEVLELDTPDDVGVVSMDIYDFGEAAVYNAYGPRWCIEGSLFSDGSACSIGVGLIYRSYMDCNTGYAMGYETSRTGAWYSPSFFSGPRQCTMETFVDPDYMDDGVGQWTTWTIEALSSGTAEIRATFGEDEIVQNAWWNDDPMIMENMDKVWISGGSSSALQVASGTYAGYTVLVDNITLNEDGCVLPGDVNLDGTVNIYDFLILRSNYGTPSGATWEMGDMNDDGAINIYDFLILRGNYGASCPQ